VIDGAASPTVARGIAVREILSILSPWRWNLALVAALVVVAALLELVPPLLMRRIIDEHLTPGLPEGLLEIAAFYLLASIAVEAAAALATYRTAVAAQGALHELRIRLFSHLQQMPTSYYDRTPLGDIISRCTADVETVNTLFSTGVARVVADLVRLVTVSIAMVVLSLPLAVISALVVPPLAVVTRQFQIRVRAAERETRLAVGDLTSHLQEDLGGVEVIRAFHREAAFVARFRRALATMLAAFNRATLFAALYPPLTTTLAAAVTALLLWVATGDWLASWDISLGTLTAFVLLFQRFFKPITALGDEWQTVQSALSGAERIFQVLGMRADDPSTNPLPETRTGPDSPAVALDQVTFGYLPGRPVLRDVSLHVRPGEHVALVGRTGAGKTSVLGLVGGLYPPWSGTVRVVGRDPRGLPADRRRRVIGAVPQVVQLFSGTVFDNLTLYERSVAPEVVERAAAVTGADAFIATLPYGYETPLSGMGRGTGVQLSAGQLQLLALTRALVWDPALLVLDEATAAIDGASDAAFRAALRAGALRRGSAVLTVAHRLSTAREADRVIVLDAGRIVEEGPPERLVRSGGRFAALVELEAAGWDWNNGVMSDE
jgi:ATP-binding cassette, subfamily B, multidrug efflux pump